MTREYSKSVCGIVIFCDVISMGKDYTICIWDNRGGHVGSAAMAISRPSLTGEGVSVTTSVLNRLGHKDEEIARHVAEAAAMAGGEDCAAVCTCGIHIDGISPEQIREILEACRELERQIVEDLQTGTQKL